MPQVQAQVRLGRGTGRAGARAQAASRSAAFQRPGPALGALGLLGRRQGEVPLVRGRGAADPAAADSGSFPAQKRPCVAVLPVSSLQHLADQYKKRTNVL